jgi:hypothetical protein
MRSVVLIAVRIPHGVVRAAVVQILSHSDRVFLAKRPITGQAFAHRIVAQHIRGRSALCAVVHPPASKPIIPKKKRGGALLFRVLVNAFLMMKCFLLNYLMGWIGARLSIWSGLSLYASHMSWWSLQ